MQIPTVISLSTNLTYQKDRTINKQVLIDKN